MPSAVKLSLALCAAAALAAAPPPGPSLQGSFVWCASAPAGAQAFVAFRRDFMLPSSLPAAAQLHVFADARYVLYVNGVAAARGPCRFDPRSPDYDSVDVAALLRPGANSLSLLVHNFGPGAIQGRIMYHAPGLTARFDVGGAPLFSTDAQWACSSATEHMPSPVAWGSIPDIIDLRAPIGDWRAPGYDASGWPRASAAAAPPGTSWGALQPRALPMPRETPLAGLRLLYPGAARPLADALPITLRPGDSVQIDLGVMAMAHTTLVLDSSDAGNNLQCIYYISYVNGGPSEDHGVGCDYFTRAGAGQIFEGIDSWVAHYVVYGFSNGTGTITLRNVTAMNRNYPFERAGSFAAVGGSADAGSALSEIWTRAVNTLVAVTDDAYGSDARERNEWLQDPAQPNWVTTSVALVPTDAAHARTSDARLLRQIVRHAALTQEADGRLHATFPTDRGPSDCHWFIEDYALQWVQALRIVVDSTADLGFAAQMWPVLVKQLAWFANRTQANGLLLAREYTSFDDAVAYVTLHGTALNAFLVRAYRDAAYLGRAVGAPAQAAAYDAAGDALVAAINARLWDDAAQTYSAGIMPDGTTVLGPSVHAALIMLDRGEVPAARLAGTRAWFSANYNNNGVFNVCTNANFTQNVANRVGVNEPVTMFWVFSVLYGMDTQDRDVEVLAQMRSRWAPMLARNDTGTLWESFQDSESCHNYGSTPAWFLSTRVLGVRRDAPVGQRALVIEPHLGDLDAASGVVVTELGLVSVSWALVFVEHLYLTFNISLPAGVGQATLRVPGAEGDTFVVNGARVPTTQEGRYGVTQLGAGPAVFSGGITLGPPLQRAAPRATTAS